MSTSNVANIVTGIGLYLSDANPSPEPILIYPLSYHKEQSLVKLQSKLEKSF